VRWLRDAARRPFQLDRQIATRGPAADERELFALPSTKTRNAAARIVLSMPPMSKRTASEHTERERILAMLSDEENARVSDAEADFRLTNGDEYIELDHLDRGLQRARGIVGSLGTIIPRKSVHTDTWKRIVASLPPAATTNARPSH
jgi:hypothetical protein